jgi:Tol biopolymer transport system component
VSVKEARQVTTGSQIIVRVDISADGKWLVFDSNQSGNRSLFKMPVGGGEPVQLAAAPIMDCCASWSPDGKELAFHAFRRGNRDIFLVSADGGTVRQLTNHPAQERYPHWSPDGTKIVFQSHGNGANGIYVLSRDKGEPCGEARLQLTFDGGAYPRWSPDGRFVAYGVAGGGVWLVPAEGGQPRRITDFGDWPMWSQDSQTIYFKENPPFKRAGIWSISLSGGEARLLVRFDDPTRAPARPEWSSNGDAFYFTLTENEADVWVMELEDSRN